MMEDDNTLVRQRRDKLHGLRAQGQAFPNDARPVHKAGQLQQAYALHDKAVLDDAQALQAARAGLEEQGVQVSVAGRLMAQRVMGKSSFAGLRDVTGDIQLFVNQGELGDERYDFFRTLDIGDIVYATGTLFLTRTGELSVRVSQLRLLTKALRPLPEKFHGLSDQETRYRQRYVDLIVNETTRETFRVRTAITAYIRQFLIQREYLEVETPMLQVIPGGAAAEPFVTHHNALGIDLYLRIAPELYLKRLVVGGFERVFEINRNFRNEGLSTRHNPEFTMLEFYQAYADYIMLMDLTEELLRGIAREVMGRDVIELEGEQGSVDFGQPFARLSLFDSILQFNDSVTATQLGSLDGAQAVAESLHLNVEPSWGLGKVQTEIFEATVEHRLIQPTFITAYPAEVSPLARRNDKDPHITDRFEMFVGGREIANGFSEINDPEDQAERFRAQVASRDSGDAEAMHYDADYVRALEYGMPPTAGEGIGIDRMVMLMTGSPSIRDVVLFPHMKPEGGGTGEPDTGALAAR